MKKIRLPGAVITLVAVACLSLPSVVRGFQLDVTCSVAADVIAEGDPASVALIRGQLVGTVGMLANLVCAFTEPGDPQCACLRDATESESPRLEDLREQADDIIAECAQGSVDAQNRSLSGISYQAAVLVCP